MKRMISLLMAAFMLTGLLSACNTLQKEPSSLSGSAEASSGEKLNIVTTIFPQYDFVRQIAGDHAEITMLLKPGAESHSFEPTPQDIKKIQSADLFIYNGGENDMWVDDILSSMGEARPETLKLMDCVSTVKEEIVEGMEHADAEHDHDDGEFEDSDVAEEIIGHEHEQEQEHGHEEILDEHIWTSPANAILIVEKLAALMQEKDPENATAYADSSVDYIQKLRTLDEGFREVVSSSARKTMIFGDRFPFRYFADAYGLTYYAAFSGCSTETEASAATVAFLVNKVKEEKLPVVFTIEFSSGKIADSVCDATGAKKLTLYSCHNVSADEFANGATYLSVMQKNMETLREALN